MKILIAEDDLSMRRMLERILQKWGYQVIATSNGLEALDELKKESSPSLAILDWVMPEMDGLTVCKEIRAIKKDQPMYIIIVSARDEREDIVSGLDAGADDYIIKPYDFYILQARISVGFRMLNLQNELLEKKQLQGVLEMAGAICHELNQPLQSISGHAELLLMDLNPENPHFKTLELIKKGVEHLGCLTRKIMSITKYRSKTYLNTRKIVDIDLSSR